MEIFLVAHGFGLSACFGKEEGITAFHRVGSDWSVSIVSKGEIETAGEYHCTCEK